MAFYSAFGCFIQSDLPLGVPVSGPGLVELSVERAEVPLAPPPDLRGISPFMALSARQVWHRIPGVFRAHAVSAERIQWQIEGDVSARTCVEFLLDLVLPAVFWLKGYGLRNGIAVADGDCSALVLGENPAAASCLLLELMASGFEFLSEGLCVYRRRSDGAFEVLPGVPRIRVWEDRACLLHRVGGARFREEVCVSAYSEEAFFRRRTPRRLSYLFIPSGSGGQRGMRVQPRELRGKERTEFLAHGRFGWLADAFAESRIREMNLLEGISGSVSFFQAVPSRMGSCVREIMANRK